MTKRILSVLLCLAMCLTVMPIFASAETRITEIALSDIETVPYGGEKAEDHLGFTLPPNCHYSVSLSYWYDEDNGNRLPGNADTFTAGKEYSRKWVLTADEGYYFSTDPIITINGSSALVDTVWSEIDEGNSGLFEVWMLPTTAEGSFSKVIDTIRITDVEVTPYVGEKTNDHLVYSFPSGCHFTSFKHGWYDINDKKWVDGAEDTFEAGHSYKVGWWLDATDGYTFAEDPTITINGGEDIDWKNTYIDEDDSTRFYVWTTPVEAVELTVIDKIEVNGFCDPVVGKKAGDYTCLTIPEGAPYHFGMGQPRWYDDTDGNNMGADDVFLADQFYSLGGTLYADEGYMFAKDAVVVLNAGSFNILNEDTHRDSGKMGTFYVWGASQESVSGEKLITEIDIDGFCDAVTGGEAGDYTHLTIPEGAHYHFSASNPRWWDDTDWSPLEEDDIFAANHSYSLGGTLKADEGYTFTKHPRILLDGGETPIGYADTEIDSTDNTTFYIWSESKQPTAKVEVITKIEINGFCDAVVDGKAGDYIHLTIPEGAPYHFGEGQPRWYDDTDGNNMGADALFAEGHSYSLGGSLYADEGYVFAEEPEIVLNGGEVAVLTDDTGRDDVDAMKFYVWGESKQAVPASDILKGDANEDGSVDMKDVLMIRKSIAKMSVTINETAADANGDNSVDMKDVLLIRKFIAKLVETL